MTANCWECLKPIEAGEPMLRATTTEDGVIHGVHYPVGTSVVAHMGCVKPA